jgi:hypothetical protein
VAAVDRFLAGQFGEGLGRDRLLTSSSSTRSG